MFNFFEKSNLKLLNRHVLDAICDLIQNGHSQYIDRLFKYFNPCDVSERVVQTSITRLIEIGQANIVPQFFEAIHVNDKKYKTFFLSEMQRLKMSIDEINQIMESFKFEFIENKSEDYLPEQQDTRQWNQSNDSNSLQTDKGRFHASIREGNVDEVESIMERSYSLIMTNCKYALLVDLYTAKGDLTKAMKILKLAKANDTAFKLNPIHLSRLISLMVDRDCDFDTILKLIEGHRPEQSVHLILPLWSLFSRLAKAGNDELLNKLYDAIVENNLLKETVDSNTPLITVHLTKGDFVRAVEVYEKIVKQKNLTPQTFELMRQMIKEQQIELLQKVYDIFKEARGESTALYRLAFAHIACGNEKEAHDIFKSGKINDQFKKVKENCFQLEKWGRVDETKLLLKVTENTPFLERHRIYQTLLEIYCNQDKIDEALDLWQQFRNENYPTNLSKNFKKRLIQFLRANKRNVPEGLF